MRSLTMWRQVSAARRALEEERASGGTRTLEELLRDAGVDASFLDAVRAQLEAPAAVPAPDLDAAPDAAPDADCVVRSEAGRISLRIV